MTVRLYEEGDEDKIVLQEAQSYMQGHIDNLNISELAKHSRVWVSENNGVITAMGGLVPMWTNRAQAWMMIADSAGANMMEIHKAVKQELINAPYVRIESTVDVGFKQGARWMKMLGFELEGYMKAYRPDGADMLLYSRVRR